MLLQSEERYDTTLIDWKANPKYEFVPNPKNRRPDMDPCGEWTCDGHLVGSMMLVRRSENENYEVEFYSWGCLARWKMSRTATYHKGVLKLNLPVLSYVDSTPFDKFYAVRHFGRESLLTSSRCPIFETGFHREPIDRDVRRSDK
jgi:hypothetical protein